MTVELSSPPSRASLKKKMALIADLASADNRLCALTAGQADAVIGPDGRAYLLQLAQENLRQSETRFGALLEGAGNIVLELSDSGEILMQSASLTKVLGYEPDAILGRCIFELVHEEDLVRVQHACLKAVQSRLPSLVNFRQLASDGAWLAVDATIGIWQSRDEKGFIVSFHPSAGPEVPENARESSEVGTLLKNDRFFAMLAHELRAPLSPVLLGVAALQRHERFAEAGPTLEMIRRNLELQSRLIDDLLDFVTVGRKKLRLHQESVDVHEILHLVLQTCRAEIDAAQIHVILDLKAVETVVFGDSLRIQQIMWNVIKNAVKFSRAGGHLSVSTMNEPTGHLIIGFADDGAGIRKDFLPKVFDAFEQEGQVVPHGASGLGLGMFIARELAEAQCGTLCVDSKGPGLGSTFTLGFQSPRKVLEEVAFGTGSDELRADPVIRFAN